MNLLAQLSNLINPKDEVKYLFNNLPAIITTDVASSIKRAMKGYVFDLVLLSDIHESIKSSTSRMMKGVVVTMVTGDCLRKSLEHFLSQNALRNQSILIAINEHLDPVEHNKIVNLCNAYGVVLIIKQPLDS